MKVIKSIDVNKLQEYLEKNKDRPIQEVYDFIKSKKVRKRSIEEHLVYNYIILHKKEFGIK